MYFFKILTIEFENWDRKLIFSLSALNLYISFFVNKQITIINIVMQTQSKFCLYVTKLILNLFSTEPLLSLISSIGPSPFTKKLFLQLSVWDDELLSTLKPL